MVILRAFTILKTVLYFGLDTFIPNVGWGSYLKKGCAVLFFWRTFRLNQATRLRLALETLGPIFIKFGQTLSTRRDLFSATLADELAKLQDSVPPFPSAQAQQLIVKNLKKPIAALFTYFNELPVASASVAQVHEAVLPSGERVAVKVLRPNIRHMIEQDLFLMRLIAFLIETLWKDGKRLRLREVVAEFARHLYDELNLMHEAANASQIRRNFGDSSILFIPKVFFEYCAKEVMVMEWIEGITINHIPAILAAGIDLKQLARHGVEIFFTQVFRDGFFHADMHPGNIFVAPDGRYIAVDFGIVGTLTDFDKHYLAVNFLAFFNRDYKRVATAHVECGWAPPDTRPEELESAVRTVCEPIFHKPLVEISFGQVLLRLFEVSRRFHIKIQPQLILLQKTLLNVEGLGRELDPELNLWHTAKPFLERWMNEEIGWRAFVRNMRREIPQWANILPILPRKLAELSTLSETKSIVTHYQTLLRNQKKHNHHLLLIIIILITIMMLL